MKHGLMRHHRRWKGKYIFGGIIMMVFGMCFLSLIFGYPLMLLWNWLMPVLFGLPAIAYLQAVGLFILGRLLFGVFFPHRPPMMHHDLHDADSDGCWSKGGWGKWKYYDSFWKEQGKAAFEEYVKKCSEEKSGEPEKK